METLSFLLYIYAKIMDKYAGMHVGQEGLL